MFEENTALIEDAKRIDALEKHNAILREALNDTTERLYNYWYCDDTGRTPEGTLEAIERNKTLLQT